MTRAAFPCALGAPILGLWLLLLASCGGGGGTTTLRVTVTAVNPTVSQDLNGGDLVTVTGRNFVTGQVFSVTFGAVPGTNLQVLGETTLRVRTPPAPGGNPGTVALEIFSLEGGNFLFFDAFTYVDSVLPPQPQTITPTTYTPTGAEGFTIGGTNLGPPGGTVDVIFEGIGTVTGNVSMDAQFVTGRAPVSLAEPPLTARTVTIDTGTTTADVPTQVSYQYASPTALTIPGQAQGNASQPVALAPGYALMCTAGNDLTWGTADDEVLLVLGPPNVMAVTPVRRPGNLPVGHLDPVNSIPAVLDGSSACLLSVGLDMLPATADDRVTLLSRLQTAPNVQDFPFTGHLNPAPLARISGTRIAFTTAGADLLLGTPDDTLLVAEFNLASNPATLGLTRSLPSIGPVDTLVPGPANFSIPFSGDGDTVLVMSVGANGTAGDGDDSFSMQILSTLTSATLQPATFLLGRPVPLAAGLFAAPGAGPNTTFGDADDVLSVFSLAGTWSRTNHALGQPLRTAMVAPFVRVGTGGLALAIRGPDSLVVFTDPLAGTKATLALPGAPVLVRLGSGDLAVFGPGADLLPRAGNDDQALWIPADASVSQAFSALPTLPQTAAPLADQDRAFGVSPGTDGTFGTNDDLLEVFQTRALAATVSVTRLGVGGLGAAPLAGQPFVPVGVGWGLMQSPGTGGWGTMGTQLLIVRY